VVNEAIQQLLKRYAFQSISDEEAALREIAQEIVLLGLWRAKFFEHAAFYGGTALRILHGLDRFSEDLDFSLLASDTSFRLEPTFDFITSECEAFGFEIKVEAIDKIKDSAVRSAFVKGQTQKHLILIGSHRRVQRNRLLKVKFEVDTDPPSFARTEARFLFQPVPFSVLAYDESSLLAGKIHALLYRRWQNRVKGRDWYDWVWLIARGVKVNLAHLEARMRQSGNLTRQALTLTALRELIHDRIDSLDIDAAKEDVRPFLRDTRVTDAWSRAFFYATADRMRDC
jgi:predicted nucleotidyltransferase component of viral defense system